MSHVKAYTTEIEKARTSILRASQITRDQYSEMMFQHGTLFAEHFCRHFLNRDDLTKELLQNSKYSYWDWFKMQYGADDIFMLNNECLPDKNSVPYEQMKACLIGDEQLEKDLYHFIKPYL